MSVLSKFHESAESFPCRPKLFLFISVTSSLSREDLVKISFAEDGIDDSQRDTDSDPDDPVDKGAAPVVTVEGEELKMI